MNQRTTFESIAGYRKFQAPGRQVFVEFVVQLFIEAQLRAILSRDRGLVSRGGRLVLGDRDVIVDLVHGIVFDRRVEDLEGAPFQAVEGILVARAPLEQLRVLTFTGHQVAE